MVLQIKKKERNDKIIHSVYKKRKETNIMENNPRLFIHGFLVHNRAVP